MVAAGVCCAGVVVAIGFWRPYLFWLVLMLFLTGNVNALRVPAAGK